MKIFKKVLLVALLILSLFLSGCEFFQGETEYFTVTFDGSNAQRVEKGKTATKIEAIGKEGYEFDYWTLNDEEFNFNTKIKEDIDLISKYHKRIFVVTFNVNGAKTDVKVEYGLTVTKPQNPVIENRNFVGWYIGENEYDFSSKVLSDITLDAKFADELCNVTLIVDGIANKNAIVKGASFIPENPIKEGYNFVGWYKDDVKYEFGKAINEDITVEAKFEKIVCVVRFINNITKEEITQNVEWGTKLVKPADPVLEGYDFYRYDYAGKEYDFNSLVYTDINIYLSFIIKRYNVKFVVDEDTYNETNVEYNGLVQKPGKNPTKTGYEFKYWKNGNVEYDFNTKVKADLTLTAYFEKLSYKVTFMVDSSKYDEVTVEADSCVTKPANPTKSGYTFVSWKNGNYNFDFNTKVNSNLTLTAEFVSNSTIVVEYDFGYDCFQTKEDLRVAFYTDFYNFMLGKDFNFSRYNISSLNDFLVAMDDFDFNGTNEMGGIGYAFASNFIKKVTNGKLENQPETVFLGWCYKNNKYVDFIHHLETFFGYWREDEGWSTGPDDSRSKFYDDAWSSMVDTAKFFYFNGDTLQTRHNRIYAWFDSERVHYALDHIPGVGRVTLTYTSTTDITLPTDITRAGYTFKGWFNESGVQVTKAVVSTKVIAHWEEGSVYPGSEDQTKLELLALEFLEDFNKVNNKNFDDPAKLDTSKLESAYMVAFGNDSAMKTKWMWLFRALADINNEEGAYLELDGFDWENYKGFYLANICGLFTQTQHKDTFLSNVSFDFSKSENVDAILNYDKVAVKFMDGGSVKKIVMVEKNSKVSEPLAPTKEGFSFEYWKNGTTKFDFNTLITSDTSLSAEWKINVYKVNFVVDGQTKYTADVNYNQTVSQYTAPTKTGYRFVAWMDGENEFSFETAILKDYTLVAKYEVITYTVTFKVDNNTYATKTVEYNQTVEMPNNPTKEGYTFKNWKNGSTTFDPSTKILSDLVLVAEFEEDQTQIVVTYDFGYDCFQTKEDLRRAYYTDFYNFLVSKGHGEFTTTAGTNTIGTFTVNNLETFLEFMDTWQIGDRKEMGFIGNELGSYYLTKDENGKLEDQPDSTFVGWCYKNNKYRDFLPHLIEFFAYWRTDEGYTTPTNHGNDFFYDSWAAMVDTAKFFHFTSETLRTRNNAMYSWFNSERVDYALDHIPGVGRVTLVYTSDSLVTLPTDITRVGYVFNGWVDSNNNTVTQVTKSMTVKATWTSVATPVYTIRAEAKTNGYTGSETNWYCATPSQTINGYLFGYRLILVQDGDNYKVAQILNPEEVIEGEYAYRIVNYDNGYQPFNEAIKIGQKVTASSDGDYIIFNFYN